MKSTRSTESANGDRTNEFGLNLVYQRTRRPSLRPAGESDCFRATRPYHRRLTNYQMGSRMAKDDPGRQPFTGFCQAISTPVDAGVGAIGPVPAKKRLVVEAVSAQLVTSLSGQLYTMQINVGAFQLMMIPVLISDGPFNSRHYCATHSIRFYVEAGQTIGFQVATAGDGGDALCCVSGYFLDV